MPQRPFFAQDPSARVGKVDARIVALLSRDDQGLAQLQADERAQLAERRARIATLEGAIAATSDAAKQKVLERELARLSHARISPLSTGICLPRDDTPGRERWVRRDEIHLSALIRFDGADEELAAHDVVVRARIGDVVSAWIPIESLRELVARGSVRAVELACALHGDLGDAVGATYTNAVDLHTHGETGAGVLIGIVDDAIDLHHPEFRNADGTTRLVKLFDHSAGAEYDASQIDKELLAPEAGDPIYTLVPHAPAGRGHGTGVAGCAAGNGSGVATAPVPGPTPGKGLAPGAAIAFVAYAPPFPEEVFGESADVVKGVDELFALADANGLPCVVNLSLGDDLGPHDGTTLLEKAIDAALLWPGRVVTVSAGNSHDDHPHVRSEVPDGATLELELEYQSKVGVDGAAIDPTASDALEIWYQGAGSLDLKVEVPADVGAGLAATTSIGTISPTPASAATPASVTTLANGVQVVVVSQTGDPRNGDHLIRVEIVVPPGERVPLGTWRFELEASGGSVAPVDAWVDRNNAGLRQWVAPAPLDETTLGCPATAASAITVGSHTRIAPPVYPSAFSGRGPTRTGDAKPDLAALGEKVTVPLAETRTAKGAIGSYQSVAGYGTSYSAPMVAGAAALLFDCHGASATWLDVKETLMARASDLAPPGADLDSGAGSLLLDGACDGIARKVDVWLRDDATDTGPEPFTGPVFWRSPDVELVDAGGMSLGRNPRHDPSTSWTTVVRVTVRNRGTQAAGPTTVHLYWADPGTNLPFPAAWHTQGFFVGAGFAVPGNAVTVDAIPAGGQATVEIAWGPPAPGGNLAGDDHYCLLVRAENAADPSFVAPGGFESIRARNNLALFNVHVLVVPPPFSFAPPRRGEREREGERDGERGRERDGERHREGEREAELAHRGEREALISRFLVVGSAGVDGLRVDARGFEGEVDLVLPFACLPWREASRLDRVGPRPPFGAKAEDPLRALSALVEGPEVERRTGARGARRLLVEDGVAVLTLAGRELALPALSIERRARVPAALRVRGARVGEKSGWIDVCQLSDGGRLGGVSIELRPARDDS